MFMVAANSKELRKLADMLGLKKHEAKKASLLNHKGKPNIEKRVTL
jgi:hypothetical protein